MAQFIPFITKAGEQTQISVSITRMKQSEARITGKNPVWQTDWTSDYLQDLALKNTLSKQSPANWP